MFINDVVSFYQSASPDGTDISIYSRLAPGQCSVMGFDWENQEKLIRTMQWSQEPEVFSNLVRQIMKEFSVLGKKRAYFKVKFKI